MTYVVEEILKTHKILIHMEPCAMHGIALVKNRVGSVKSITAALVSFTKWLRVSANHDAFAKALIESVRATLVIRSTPKLDEHRSRAQAFIDLLFGGAASSYLWKKDRHGNQVKKSLLTDLEEVLQYCSFDVGGPASVFWNSVEEGSDEHLVLGMAVGSKLYNSREQGIERVGAAFHNFFCGRTWVVANEARWTHIGLTSRRWLIGLLFGRSLVEALKTRTRSFKTRRRFFKKRPCSFGTQTRFFKTRTQFCKTRTRFFKKRTRLFKMPLRTRFFKTRTRFY
jgi:hypothetical protein